MAPCPGLIAACPDLNNHMHAHIYAYIRYM